MHPVFESRKNDFERYFVDFNVIKSDNMLMKVLARSLSRPSPKPLFLWQMRGNQIMSAIKNAVEQFNDDTDYYIVPRDASPDQITSYQESHMYDTEEEASLDTTTGFIIFSEFTESNENLREFVLGVINNKTMFVAKNWRIVFTGNIDEADGFWKPEFSRTFVNMEYNPVIRTDRFDDPDEEYGDESESRRDVFDSEKNVSEGFSTNDRIMSPEKAKEVIYTILYNAAKKGDISSDEYIYIDKDGVIVDEADGFNPETLRMARKAENFIDFDALENGQVIIYTKPLYIFIEESIGKNEKNVLIWRQHMHKR